MPTYEYKCTQDNSVFELWQEVGAAAPACPSCGAPSKKVFRPVRTIFKGSGFYLTDTRAESAPKSSESSNGDSSGTSSAAPSDSGTPAASASESKTQAPAPASGA